MSALRRRFKVSKAKLAASKRKHFTVERLNKRVSRLEKNVDLVTVFTDTDDSNVFTTPLVIPLQAGGAGSEMILRKIHLKGVVKQLVATASTILTRIVIVRDKLNTTDTATVWLQVFRENEVFSHRALDIASDMPDKRFTIVYDKVFNTTHDNDAMVDDGRAFNFVKSYKGLLMHQIEAGHGEKNGYYLMMMSDGATGLVTVSSSVAMVFTRIDN